MSGIKGYLNKKERRKKSGDKFYRDAKKTLASRIRKKLVEKTTWCKHKKNIDEELDLDSGKKQKTPSKWLPGKKRGEKRQNDKHTHMLDTVEEERKSHVDRRSIVKAVVFELQTEHSTLAKKLRVNEEEM